MRHTPAKFLLAFAILLFTLPLSATERGVKRETSDTAGRHALVIGNSDYEAAGKLANPVNDADAMERSLKSLGFEVIALKNAGQREMERAITKFGRKLRKGGIGIFFYAGHGIQAGGENYMLPVDANPTVEDDLRYEAVALGRLLNQMADAQNGMNLVILDACRNNPFKRSFRSASKGLAQVTAPTGTFISYATAPGSVAADGTGKNGLYTSKLIANMNTPGLSIESVFKRVRSDVQKESNGKQVPWDSSSLVGDFYFVPPDEKPEPATVATLTPTPAPESRPTVTPSEFRADEEAWKDIKNSSDLDDFRFFLEEFPASPLAKTAKFKLRRLERKQPKAKAEQQQIAEAKRKAEEEQKQQLAEEAKQEEQRKRQEELAALKQKQESSGVWTEPSTRMKFRRIPGGSFRMGSPFSEQGRDDDETSHTVSVGKFWLGETEVTVGQFRQFVRASGHRPDSERKGCWWWTGSKWEEVKDKNWKSPGFSQGESHPVACVSWHDAAAYAQWLSRETGKRFRLPTEAEWEYAARAGTRTARYWGEGIGNNNANCGKCGSRWDGKQTAPVGSFRANDFGLFDMLGNVWEWTCSEFLGYDKNGHKKCLSNNRAKNNNIRRSLRGGSWSDIPRDVRFAYRGYRRYFLVPDFRSYDLGFRLAQDK